MAVFSENMTGGVKIRGCALDYFFKNVQTLFAPGDIVYWVKRAQQGILEKIVIKQQVWVKKKKTYNEQSVMYRDTLNGLWNEWELTDYDTARTIAANFWLDLQESLDKANPC